MSSLTINQVLAKAEAGTLVPSDVFYDWFCSDASLVNRTKSLIPKLKLIAKSPLVNPETTYVFFKNNCPMDGNTYDSISVTDGPQGDVVLWLAPASGHRSEKGVAQLTNFANGKDVSGTWSDIKNYLRNPS